MPYNCPDRVSLELATRNLQKDFNFLAKRYTSPSFEALALAIGKLESSYREKVQKKSGWFSSAPDPVRLEQINCIVLVLRDLQGAQASEEIKAKAHPVILGALLYRYQRILNEYKKCSALWGRADNNSALHVCVKELLKINDMNRLDSQTLVTSCTAYRDYLKGNDGEMAKRYNYIVNDIDYFKNLQEIIDDATEKAQVMNEQLQFILFIQSTREVLLRYEQEVINTLEKFKEKLSSKLELSENALDNEDILACLPEVSAMASIASLNLLRFIINNDSDYSIGDDEELGEFLAVITQKVGVFVHYGLLGAYILTLGHTEQTTCLSNVIRNAIHLYGDNVLDQKTQEAAFTALSTFVESANDFSVSADAWQGIELFKSELGRQLIQSRVQHLNTNLSIPSSYSPSFSSV